MTRYKYSLLHSILYYCIISWYLYYCCYSNHHSTCSSFLILVVVVLIFLINDNEIISCYICYFLIHAKAAGECDQCHDIVFTTTNTLHELFSSSSSSIGVTDTFMVVYDGKRKQFIETFFFFNVLVLPLQSSVLFLL